MSLKTMTSPRTFEWKITKDGDLVCRDTGYYITKDRLNAQDWIDHMFMKNWVIKDKFLKAYKMACELAGIKRVPKGYDGEMINVCDL